MDTRTFQAVFEDGEVTFAEPVDMKGCWRVQVTFLEQEDTEDALFERSPHSPEKRMYLPDRLDELHRQVDSERPHPGPA